MAVSTDTKIRKELQMTIPNSPKPPKPETVTLLCNNGKCTGRLYVTKAAVYVENNVGTLVGAHTYRCDLCDKVYSPGESLPTFKKTTVVHHDDKHVEIEGEVNDHVVVGENNIVTKNVFYFVESDSRKKKK
jgi:hypothetical protein